MTSPGGLPSRAAASPEPIRIARWSVARVLRSLGRFAEALTLQQRLLEEHEQAGTTDGYVFEELAECQLALGRLEAARPYFARGLALLSQDSWFCEQEPQRLARLREQSLGP